MLIEPYYHAQSITLYKEDCIELLPNLAKNSVSMIFADPPYNLSNGGITCKAGRIVCVDKADWDKSKGFENDYNFTYKWIKLCFDILKPDGTIWISGTPHNIHQVGFALQSLGYHILNDIVWYKPNAPPNLACRCFAHAHETLIWAKKVKDTSHFFNYQSMKDWNDKISPHGKQMRSIWNIPLTPLEEKSHGRHPTQKPIELLKRIITSSTKPNDTVLDPFNGSGTTGLVSLMLKRNYIGIDKEEDFLRLSIKRFDAFSKKI
jgi:site-specific DNA-methyltransferase (adenine-specific)